MFNDKQKEEFYELNLQGDAPKKYIFSELASQTQSYPPKAEPVQVGQKQPIKNKAKDLVQSLGYSAAIFTALFLFMNWSAYSQIFNAQVDKFQGDTKVSVLQDLIDEELDSDISLIPTEMPTTNIPTTRRTFNLIKTPEQKQTLQTAPESSNITTKAPTNLPDLDMEIRPPDTRLIIPRLNKNVPIVQVRPENLINKDWNALEEDIMEALRYGIVHFPGTAMPGEHGNIAMTGHSSYFPWDPGRFKDVFALLHDVQMGDHILLYHKQKKYIYEVSEIKVVKPDEIDILKPSTDDRLTLITCTPVGTNLKRLVVIGKLIKVS